VIEESDIWRAAKLLIDQHGEDAARMTGFSVRRVQMMAARPD
jgi:hypothetical protein